MVNLVIAKTFHWAPNFSLEGKKHYLTYFTPFLKINKTKKYVKLWQKLRTINYMRKFFSYFNLTNIKWYANKFHEVSHGLFRKNVIF